MSMPSTANFPTTRVSDHKGLTSSWVSFRSEDFFLSRCAANLSYSSGVRISFLVDETWKEALVAKYLHCSSFKMSLSDFQEHPKTIHCHPLLSIAIRCFFVYFGPLGSHGIWLSVLSVLGSPELLKSRAHGEFHAVKNLKSVNPSKYIKIHQNPNPEYIYIYSMVHVVFWW